MQNLIDYLKFVTGLAAVIPSTSVPDAVTLKNYDGVLVIITQKNSTSATGSAITLKQALTVAGGSEKALGFDFVYLNIDTASAGGDVLVKTAVTSDTFTMTSVDSKDAKYIIDVPTTSLDATNDFDIFSVDIADGAANTVNIEYVLYNARYKPVIADSVITD